MKTNWEPSYYCCSCGETVSSHHVLNCPHCGFDAGWWKKSIPSRTVITIWPLRIRVEYKGKKEISEIALRMVEKQNYQLMR